MPAVYPTSPERTRETFAIQLLQWLGVPVTDNNKRAILAQMLAEEPAGEGAPNNPLNTTRDVDKYGGWSAAPNIASYPSWHIGIMETADTYKQSMYASVIRDLKASADPSRTVRDIGASPWGTSGSLMQQILAGGGDLAKDSTVPGPGKADITRSTGFQTDPVSGALSSAKDAVTSVPGAIENAIGSAVSTVEDFALRAGKILLGIILLAAAIFIGVKQ